MSASRHEHPELGAPELIEVADRVFAYVQPDGSWYINNTGFVVGRSGVISIDACSTERRTRAYLDRIASVSPAPVTMLVNTHHHGDHTYGNSLFGGAVIIGHENCRTAMIATGLLGNTGIWDPVDWGDLTLAPPVLTFTDRIRLWPDDHPLDVSFAGQAAHTTNDALVWLPEHQVLFCGDLLGPPCDHQLIGVMAGYMEFVLATAAKGIAAGLSPLELARETDLGEYAGWLDSERIVGNLHRAYADLGAAGPDVDVLAAFRDMVDYNGGKPLSCFA